MCINYFSKFCSRQIPWLVRLTLAQMGTDRLGCGHRRPPRHERNICVYGTSSRPLAAVACIALGLQLGSTVSGQLSEGQLFIGDVQDHGGDDSGTCFEVALNGWGHGEPQPSIVRPITRFPARHLVSAVGSVCGVQHSAGKVLNFMFSAVNHLQSLASPGHAL